MTPEERDDFVFAVIKVIDDACLEYGWNINCFRCYKEIKKKFPHTIALYNGDHVISLVKGHLFDRSGQLYYPMKQAEPEKYRAASEWGDINPNDERE